jgi:hypothetical protein
VTFALVAKLRDNAGVGQIIDMEAGALPSRLKALQTDPTTMAAGARGGQIACEVRPIVVSRLTTGKEFATAEAAGTAKPLDNRRARQASALVVGASPVFDSYRDKLAALAARYKLPAIYQAREYVLDGG